LVFYVVHIAFNYPEFTNKVSSFPLITNENWGSWSAVTFRWYWQYFFLKVLDAPELQDDFYLNLVDWSSQNVLSVGLGSCVYLWSACTSQVTRLCDLSGDGNSVTSVAWNERVSHIIPRHIICM
jgi:hypothetical protein